MRAAEANAHAITTMPPISILPVLRRFFGVPVAGCTGLTVVVAIRAPAQDVTIAWDSATRNPVVAVVVSGGSVPRCPAAIQVIIHVAVAVTRYLAFGAFALDSRYV
ncbi:hypothetical protein ACFY19_21355 [Streptosporangium saharense]|uniref:hypothetical protein n=1 Tax=Streptosporangium saharense TaxID=1706840 RepID=UPI0036B3420A